MDASIKGWVLFPDDGWMYSFSFVREAVKYAQENDGEFTNDWNRVVKFCEEHGLDYERHRPSEKV